MQVDFRETHGMIKNMKNSLVAENYLVYSQILITLERHFLKEKNEFEARLQKLLPDLRGNRASRLELGNVTAEYDKSHFKAEHIKPFLRVRRREIEIIEVSCSCNTQHSDQTRTIPILPNQ